MRDAGFSFGDACDKTRQARFQRARRAGYQAG